jgi:hypothetical protein
MKTHREQEKDKVPQRQDRTYCVNGLWYFERRGGGQYGPFDTQKEVEKALREFIDSHEAIKKRH